MTEVNPLIISTYFQNHEANSKYLKIFHLIKNLDARYGCLWIALKYFINEQTLKENSSKTSTNSSSLLTSQLVTQTSLVLNKTNPNTTDLNIHLNDSVIKECNYLIENFNNPYLKALFNFILNGDDSIEKILVWKFFFTFYF